MKANILKDGEVVLRDVDASLIESLDVYGLRRWDGRLKVFGGNALDIGTDYFIELEDGRSGEISLGHILEPERQPTELSFRVLDWQNR